ncbi:MAG: rod shape-determining protein MreD [Candidatus Omnitrophota bacterium]|nr:rod shape-determining protein MreD [Candidatus Omnitrophota bacterium]
MKNLAYALYIVISGILQLTLLNYFSVFGVKPDLLLALVILVSLRSPAGWAVGLSLFAGILKDIFSASGFGINTLLFPLWSIAILNLNRKINVEHDYLRLALGFIIAFLQNMFCGLALSYSGRFVPLGVFTRILLLSSLYTTVTLFLFFRIDDARKSGQFSRYFISIRGWAKKKRSIFHKNTPQP